MNLKHALIATPTIGIPAILALASPPLAAGGAGESACSTSGLADYGDHVVNSAGQFVSRIVLDGDGFSGQVNPGYGIDSPYQSAGDGPLVPSVCSENPHR